MLSLPRASQPLPASPSISSLTAAWPRCAGEREGAAPAAVEHPGQMRRAHFATASPAEAAEPQACTYPAATWHGKKGHSSLRNSLRAWRHPLLTAREATGRVFPAPGPTAPPPQAGLAPSRVAGAVLGAGGGGMLPVPPHPQRSLPAPAGCQGRSRPGPDSAKSAFLGRARLSPSPATAGGARQSLAGCRGAGAFVSCPTAACPRRARATPRLPRMIFPPKRCGGTKLPHQPCLGDRSGLC